jgi:hypothetical protein
MFDWLQEYTYSVCVCVVCMCVIRSFHQSCVVRTPKKTTVTAVASNNNSNTTYSQNATKDMSKLTMAAEELIKAASTHVESSSLTIGKETVEGLKQLSVNTTSIEKSVEALKLSQESKMNTLIQSIAELKKEMTELNANVVLQTAQAVLQTKHQMLEWAISNAGMGSFEYHDHGSLRHSTGLVRAALMNFRNGSDHYIDIFTEEREKHYRDALSTQIHNLTGQKPQIVMSDGRYVIKYS